MKSREKYEIEEVSRPLLPSTFNGTLVTKNWTFGIEFHLPSISRIVSRNVKGVVIKMW